MEYDALSPLCTVHAAVGLSSVFVTAQSSSAETISAADELEPVGN